MAIKHVKDYYNKVYKQYETVLKNLEEFQKEAEQGLVEPERLDILKKQIQPIIDNYMTLSYIIYLLDMPQRDSKKKKYIDMNSKKLDKIPKQFYGQNILNKNSLVLENLNK